MRSRCRLILPAGAIAGWLTLPLLFAEPATARTWLLQAHGGGEAAAIQACADSSASGDTLLFQPGRYEIELQLADKSLTLIGAGGAAQVTLTATPTFDVGKPGLVTSMATTPQTFRAEGLTFRDGRNYNHAWGGALSLGGISLVVVRDCVFTGNSVTASMEAGAGGGAIGLWGGGDVRVEECRFVANRTQGYRGSAGQGGALMADATRLLVRRCRFEFNHSGRGGAVDIRGGACRVEECQFLQNDGVEGAALAASGPVTVDHCVFSGNVGRNGISPLCPECYGGVLSVSGSGELVDLTIIDGPGEAAALRLTGAGPFLLARSALAFNAGASVMRLDVASRAAVTLDQNLIAFNAGGIFGAPGVSLGAASCNVVWANTPDFWPTELDFRGANGNQASDPLLCTAGSLESGVVANSPCLTGGAGHPEACGVIGGVTAGCAAVSVQSTTWGGLKARYAGR